MAAKKRTTKKQRDPLAHTLKVLRKNKKATLADCNKGWRAKTKIGGRTLGEARKQLGIKTEREKVASTNGRRKKKATTTTTSDTILVVARAEIDKLERKLKVLRAFEQEMGAN